MLEVPRDRDVRRVGDRVKRRDAPEQIDVERARAAFEPQPAAQVCDAVQRLREVERELDVGRRAVLRLHAGLHDDERVWGFAGVREQAIEDLLLEREATARLAAWLLITTPIRSR